MSKTEWYYINVFNYPKEGGVERTIILNPAYTKEQIADVMREEDIDESYIRKAMENGIFQDRDISIIAKDKGMEMSWYNYKNGKQEGYSRSKFAKKDKLIFYADGTFSKEYHYTVFEKICICLSEIWETVTDKICRRI